MARDFDAEKLLDKLSELDGAIPEGRPDIAGVGPKTLKKLHETTKRAAQRLALLARWLDPVAHPETVFDPTNPRDAADLISERVLREAKMPLASISAPFWGSGVYALYYRGDHPAYKSISGADVPIYVGKADPEEDEASTPEGQGTKLYERLRKHARNIEIVERYVCERRRAGVHRIALSDFDCRYLIVHSSYTAAAEATLIGRFKPVWNSNVCDGFGKHGDSPTRRSNTRSEWDTLHPGRPWATREGNRPNPRSPKQIQTAVIEYLSQALR